MAARGTRWSSTATRQCEILDAIALAAKNIELTCFRRRGRGYVRSAAPATTSVIGGDGNDTAFLRRRQRHVHLETRATTTTSSRARPASTRFASTAPTSRKTFTSRPMADASCSPKLGQLRSRTSMTWSGSSFAPWRTSAPYVVGDLSGTDVKQVAIDLARDRLDGRFHRHPSSPTAPPAIMPSSWRWWVAPSPSPAFRRKLTVAHASDGDFIEIIALDGNDSVNASALKLNSLVSWNCSAAPATTPSRAAWATTF